MEKELEVSDIFIYPVKSLPAIECDHAFFDRRGLWNDRVFALYDSNGDMMTRRNTKGMADFELKLDGAEKLQLYSRITRSAVEVDLVSTGIARDVCIWNRVESGYVADRTVNEFFSDHFSSDVQMYFINKRQAFSSFHDDSPILICNRSSAGFLSSRYEVSIDIRRFRPNIVVEGNEYFEEAAWKSLNMDGVVLEPVKLCSRCIIINQDPDTAIVDLNVLKMLMPYTGVQNKIKFGLYVRPSGAGHIGKGEQIKIQAD